MGVWPKFITVSRRPPSILKMYTYRPSVVHQVLHNVEDVLFLARGIHFQEICIASKDRQHIFD